MSQDGNQVHEGPVLNFSNFRIFAIGVVMSAMSIDIEFHAIHEERSHPLPLGLNLGEIGEGNIKGLRGLPIESCFICFHFSDV